MPGTGQGLGSGGTGRGDLIEKSAPHSKCGAHMSWEAGKRRCSYVLARIGFAGVVKGAHRVDVALSAVLKCVAVHAAGAIVRRQGHVQRVIAINVIAGFVRRVVGPHIIDGRFGRAGDVQAVRTTGNRFRLNEVAVRSFSRAIEGAHGVFGNEIARQTGQGEVGPGSSLIWTPRPHGRIRALLIDAKARFVRCQVVPVKTDGRS